MHKKIVHLQIRFVTDKYEINIICTKDRKLRRATVGQLLKNHNTYNVEVITWSWKSKSESWEECMESFKEIEYMKLNNIYTRDLENLADDNTPLPFSLNTELHSLIYFFCFLLYFFSISTKVNKNKITLSSFWLYSPRPEIKDNLIPTFYSPYQYPKISISFFISDTIFHHNCIRKKIIFWIVLFSTFSLFSTVISLEIVFYWKLKNGDMHLTAEKPKNEKENIKIHIYISFQQSVKETLITLFIMSGEKNVCKDFAIIHSNVLSIVGSCCTRELPSFKGFAFLKVFTSEDILTSF